MSRTFQWGVDSVHLVKFNQVEANLLAAAASDNSIMLYDTRDVGPVRKVIMTLRANALAWNPMEAMVFTTASEDYNLYSFDMRKLDRPVNVYMDHVGAVVDVDYSPTGKFHKLLCQPDIHTTFISAFYLVVSTFFMFRT